MVAVHNGQLPEHNDGPERFKSPTSSKGLLIFMTIVHKATNYFIGGISISAFILANALGTNTTSVHIILCVLGYVIVMSEGILAGCSYAGWARTMTYQERKWIHMGMQGVGSLFVIIGSAIKMADVDANFISAHGICGVVAMIFTFLTLIGGVCQYFLNMPKITKIVHFACGSLTMSIAFLSLILAFTNYFRYLMTDAATILNIAMTVFTLLGILTTASINTFRKA